MFGLPHLEFYVILIYGLSYFGLSAVVFFYTKRGARCDLVESFALFGAFGLLHGIADTMGILTRDPLSLAVGAGAIAGLRVALGFASWVVLLRFSLNILIRDDQARADLQNYSYLVYTISIIFLLVDLFLAGPEQAITFVSFVFGFPISLMAGAAFFLLARGSGTARIKRLHVTFSGIAFCFTLHALLRAAPMVWDTETSLAVVRLLRVTASLALAGFTGVALSSLRPARKPSAGSPVFGT